jgi:hypothetical protein
MRFPHVRDLPHRLHREPVHVELQWKKGEGLGSAHIELPYKGQERPVHHGVNWLTGSRSKRAEIANASAGPCISPGAKGRFGCQLPHPVASMFGCRSRSRTQVAPIERQCAIDFSTTTWGGGEATMARKRRMWCSFACWCFR